MMTGMPTVGTLGGQFPLTDGHFYHTLLTAAQHFHRSRFPYNVTTELAKQFIMITDGGSSNPHQDIANHQIAVGSRAIGFDIDKQETCLLLSPQLFSSFRGNLNQLAAHSQIATFYGSMFLKSLRQTPGYLDRYG
jgi:hypothetical protein